MWVDLPPITSEEISNELNKPQSKEVISVWECKLPENFQKQFDNLQAEARSEAERLQWELKYSEDERENLRNIYCNLWEDKAELKKAIETQTVKIFEIPWKDLVALSLNWTNIDFLYHKDWEIWRDFYSKRQDIETYFDVITLSYIKEDLFIDWELISLVSFIKKWGKKVPEWTKVVIVSKEWEVLNPFSEEGLNKYVEWNEYLNNLSKTLEEIIEIRDE
jgi:hypothetical protein